MSTVLSTALAKDDRRAVSRRPEVVLSGGSVTAGPVLPVGGSTPSGCAGGSTLKRRKQMKKLPIDTTVMGFIAAGVPEPVVDFESRRPKTDENGVPLYAVSVMAMAAGEADVIAIKVPGEPRGIAAGVQLRVAGLVGVPWSMDDRSGIAFRATSIEAAAGSAKSTDRAAS